MTMRDPKAETEQEKKSRPPAAASERAPVADDGRPGSDRLDSARLQRLQSTVGNRAVQRLIADTEREQEDEAGAGAVEVVPTPASSTPDVMGMFPGFGFEEETEVKGSSGSSMGVKGSSWSPYQPQGDGVKGMSGGSHAPQGDGVKGMSGSSHVPQGGGVKGMSGSGHTPDAGEMKGISGGGFAPQQGQGTVYPGSRGPSVAAVQARLNERGAGLAVDGIYGPQTGQAIQAFQAANGLAVDGIVGKNTWAALNGGG